MSSMLIKSYPSPSIGIVVNIGVFGHLRLIVANGSLSAIDFSSKNKIAVGELL